MHTSSRWLAALAAAALIVPTAAAAHHRDGHTQGPPAGLTPGLAPVALPDVATQRPGKGGRPDAGAFAPSVDGLVQTTEDAETLPEPISEPAACGTAQAEPTARSARSAGHGKGRMRPAMFVFRADVEAVNPADPQTGEPASLDVCLTGGNRRARAFAGIPATVTSSVAIIDDERAALADVWVGDEVKLQARLPRSVTAAHFAGNVLDVRRVIDLTTHVLEEQPVVEEPLEPAPVE